MIKRSLEIAKAAIQLQKVKDINVFNKETQDALDLAISILLARAIKGDPDHAKQKPD